MLVEIYQAKRKRYHLEISILRNVCKLHPKKVADNSQKQVFPLSTKYFNQPSKYFK